MYPHRIRLRGPWECEPLESNSGFAGWPSPSRVTMPCRWHDAGLSGFDGRVRFRRRFGYPGRVDEVERVWLTFAGASDSADVTLNGVTLGRRERAEKPFEFEVTALLRPRNELVVEVTGRAPGAGLWGEVALEIRRTAFLRNITFEQDVSTEAVHLHTYGEVVGSADALLELYLLLDRSTIAYKTITAGARFEIVSDAISPEQWRSFGAAPLTLDLIQGATVWYRVEATLTTEIAPHPYPSPQEWGEG
jgi:hypothetical protein